MDFRRFHQHSTVGFFTITELTGSLESWPVVRSPAPSSVSVFLLMPHIVLHTALISHSGAGSVICGAIARVTRVFVVVPSFLS